MTEETYGPRTRAWAALEQVAAELSQRTIAALFEEDPGRGDAFCVEAEGLWLDLSRQRLDSSGLELLLQLAQETQVPVWIERMFAGERINNTEDRAALHVVLRRPVDRPLQVDQVLREAHDCLRIDIETIQPNPAGATSPLPTKEQT